MRASNIACGVQASKETREDLIEEYFPVIRHLAKKLARGIEGDTIVDDLTSAAIVGLLEVAERHDPTRGTKLHTYAYLRIKGAMIDELRSHDWFPRSARDNARKIKEAIGKLEQEMGRLPDDREVAQELNVDLPRYLSMLKNYGNLSIVSIESLNDAVEESGDKAIASSLDNNEDPEKHAQLSEMKRILAQELKKLTARQRAVLTRYYHEDANLKEIASMLGVTEARVSQIRTQAIANLRPSVRRRFKEAPYT